MRELQMKEGDFIKNSIGTDYRAEFLAASMVESGFPLEQLRLRRIGISKGGKNVDSMARSFSRDELIDFVDVFTRKRDLYESLPEGLFHKQLTPDKRRGERSYVQSMEIVRQEAFLARTFFRPLEMAIDRMALLARLYEICLDKCDKHGEFVQLLASHWSILQDLPAKKALDLVHFIAASHRIMDANRIGRLLSLFLDCQVSVKRKFVTMKCQSESGWNLGAGLLGATTIVGTDVDLAVPQVEVRIDGLSLTRKELFSTESRTYKQLLRTLNLFVPADAELVVKIEVERQAELFRLSGENQESVLGYTTILG